MATRQYIGARYVTKIYENSQDPSSAEWEAGVAYEPLVLVTYMNGSYLSKHPVPASVGDPASNTYYWVQTGFYNGQVAQLQLQVSTINEELSKLNADSNFSSIRLGSINTKGMQCFVKQNNIYYICMESFSTGNLVIYEVDGSTFAILSENEIATPMHPNAAFISNGHFYVIDSTSHNIYEIDLSTFTITNIITALVGNDVFGGNVDENGDIYVIGIDNGVDSIMKVDSAFNITESFAIVYPDFPDYTITQGIFIYDSVIYIVLNQPNALLCYKLDGTYIGSKNIGLGDGFYPYGEVEYFTYDGTDVLMGATPFVTYGGNVLAFAQIFKTNIASDVGYGDIVGQDYPAMDILYVNNTGTRAANPNGSVSKPFDNIYEAACVFEYNLQNNKFYTIDITGDFSGDYSALSNCNVTISGASSKIGTWRFNNCDVYICNVQFKDIISRSSELSFFISTGTNLDMFLSHATVDRTSITGALTLSSSVIDKINEVNPASVTLTAGEIDKLRLYESIEITTSTSSTANSISKKMLSQDKASLLTLDFLGISGGQLGDDRNTMMIGTGNKSSISGGTALSKVLLLSFYLNNTLIFVPVTVTINTDFSISLTKGTPLTGNGTAYSGTVTLYLTASSIDQIETNV